FLHVSGAATTTSAAWFRYRANPRVLNHACLNRPLPDGDQPAIPHPHIAELAARDGLDRACCRRGGMSVRIRTAALVVAPVPLAAVCAALAVPASSAASPGEGVPAFGHVFLIIGENTTYSHLTASNAPYLLGTIRPQAAWLTNYDA